MKRKQSEYYHSVKNTESYKEYKREYMKERRKKYPHIFAWRSVLKNSLKHLNTDKESRTIEMLKYSCVYLKLHMESLFENGITCDNWGECHIEHIYTLSRFDKDTEPHVVNALNNLQPLWVIDNKKKRK